MSPHRGQCEVCFAYCFRLRPLYFVVGRPLSFDCPPLGGAFRQKGIFVVLNGHTKVDIPAITAKLFGKKIIRKFRATSLLENFLCFLILITDENQLNSTLCWKTLGFCGFEKFSKKKTP